jgi:hypothetical protein
MRRLLPLLAITLLLPTAVLADEVWSTAQGDLTYEEDIGTVAVLSYPAGDGKGFLFVSGLGGNTDQRTGVFNGYWIAEGDGACDATLKGPNGTESTNWGRIAVAFAEPGFPSALTILSSSCFGEFDASMAGTPVTGN